MNHGMSRKTFRCKICGKVLSEGNKIRHMRSHQGLKPYECCYCDKRFLDKRSCADHERLHTGVKPFLCSCSKAFVTDRALSAHHLRFKAHHQLFPCNHCSQHFESAKKRNRHQVDSHPSLISEHVCDICFMDFNSLKGLRRHVKNKHHGSYEDHASTTGQNGPQQLPKDDEETEEAEKVNNPPCDHDHRGEPSPKKYLCEICTTFHSTASNLKRHIRRMHEKVLVGTTKDPRQVLKEHPPSEIPHGIAGPETTAQSSDDERQSMEGDEETKDLPRPSSKKDKCLKEKFICIVCNKVKTREHIQIHYKVAMQPKLKTLMGCHRSKKSDGKGVVNAQQKQKPYRCSCSKAFRKTSGLTNHLYRNESHAKVFPCINCTMIFSSFEKMNLHRVRAHSEALANKHVCNICFKGLSTYSSLQRHVKVMHGKPVKVNGEEGDAAFDENHPDGIAEEAGNPESPSDDWELRLEEDSDDENNNLPPVLEKEESKDKPVKDPRKVDQPQPSPEASSSQQLWLEADGKRFAVLQDPGKPLVWKLHSMDED